jgi:hypothetical protein
MVERRSRLKPGPAKGQRFGGRKKGTPNKISGDVRAMVLAALHAGGGQEWLERQMDENPTAFMSLLGRILPTQIEGELAVDIAVSSEARHALAAELYDRAFGRVAGAKIVEHDEFVPAQIEARAVGEDD